MCCRWALGVVEAIVSEGLDDGLASGLAWILGLWTGVLARLPEPS